MEEYSTEPVGMVDPEVRAHVTSLVSALGGTGGYEDGRYVLGDDALACLRDIKRWLKLYDEKTNRLDVARVLAERNIVKGDLLEILSAWPEEDAEDKSKTRVALACLELLVPLTWPIEKNELNATANHYRNTPYLQLAQISYKREILEHSSYGIIRTAVRIALPSLAIPSGDRSQRDEGIIKLLLYFLRNIVMISAPANLPVEWNENEVSRSATIEAFHQQDVFPLLLTIASNMGDDFNTQDVVLLETMFHLVKGVDVQKLFLDEAQLKAKHANDLENLMKKEATMIRSYSKNAPTRHNRFGTMIWVKRDEERVSAVSGQDVLSNSQHTMDKMDLSKKWNRPKRQLKQDTTTNSFDLTIALTNSATKQLRSFVEDFLDSGFNPLFSHLRKAIEREAERIQDHHSYQFFYLTAWFLDAERARRKSKKAAASKMNEPEVAFEPDSFGIVASVLNQETFILLNRFMQEKLDYKQWPEVNAGMRGFTQILLTVQEMAESNLEEDQEIADNIQNRIFYEETTHDRVLAILRGYKDQNFSYLDACTELSHVFLRMLERYAKENVDLQVRSRRRARKKKKKDAQLAEPSAENDDAQDSEAEEIAEAQRVSKERKFDFNRFSARFVTQSCINTFVAFLAFYQDLDKEQLKRAHRFFHRVAFKQEMSVLLFRLDIIALFNRMMKGPESLSRSDSLYKEWEEFTTQLFRRLVRKVESEPALAVELLFSKINSTAYFLEYGHEKQTSSSSSRAPAALEFVKPFSFNDQLGIVISAMLGDGEDKGLGVEFVEKSLRSAASARKSWEAEADARTLDNPKSGPSKDSAPQPPCIVVKPDNDERRVQMYKYNKLRLLMTLVGYHRLGEEDDSNATWIVPSGIASKKLEEIADTIRDVQQDPQHYYGEERTPATELLCRKKDATAKEPTLAAFDEDSDGPDELDEDALLYRASGPTPRKPTALEELKKRRRKRRRSNDEEDQSQDEEAPKTKRKAKILIAKSKEFVYDSDEVDSEEDAEFFAMEETRRRDQVSKIIEALRARVDEPTTTKKRKSAGSSEGQGKKRKSSDEDDDTSDSPSSNEDMETSAAKAGVQENGAESSPSPHHHDTDRTDDGASDSPPSSPTDPIDDVEMAEVSQDKDLEHDAVADKVSDMMRRDDLEDDDEDEDVDIQPSSRRRVNAAILDDSDEG